MGHFLKTWIRKSFPWGKNRWWCEHPAVAMLMSRDCCYAHCLFFLFLKDLSKRLSGRFLFNWNLSWIVSTLPLGSGDSTPKYFVALLGAGLFFSVSDFTDILGLCLIFETHRVCEHSVCLWGKWYFDFLLHGRAL